MGQVQWRSTFGLVLTVVVGLVIVAFLVLQYTVNAQVPTRICIPEQAAETICFTQTQRLSDRKPTQIAVSRSGRLLAVGNDNQVELWDLQSSKRIQSLQGHRDLISAIAISPDEQTIASGSLDGTIKLWNAQTGELIATLRSKRVSNLVFSPDGRTLASSSRIQRWADGAVSPLGVQFWDVVTQRYSFSLGNEPIRAIAFSPDGQVLAMGSNRTQIWQVRDGELLHTLDSGEVTGLVFCQDGETLISGSSRIKRWNLATGDLLYTFATGASDLALSPDGQVLATASAGGVQFWDLLGEQNLGSRRGSWFSGLSIEFALGGHAIVSGSSDGIRIWRSVAAP
jgi:WD40 repeat protein